MLASIPAALRILLWVLVAVIIIILIALVVHALGGFAWRLHIGHFFWQIGVT